MKPIFHFRVVLILFLAVVCITTLIPLAPVEQAFAQRDHPLEWGLYQILWSRQYGQHLARELKRFDSKPDYVMFYRDLGRPFPEFSVETIHEQGATTIVSLELWSWHDVKSDHYLTDIISGKYDNFFQQWATDAKTNGRRVLLRFGFEFNGNWFTWSQKPKDFVKAWRHIHDMFQKVGAGNVEWVWSPNVVSTPDVKANNMHLYYPGDEYVDWVGVDGYNFGDHHDIWHQWQSFHDVFQKVLVDFHKRYPTKPVMISEFGCARGKPNQRKQWIFDAYITLQKYPQVQAVIWFNYDKRKEDEPNWRLKEDDGSLSAFNRTFAKRQPLD